MIWQTTPYNNLLLTATAISIALAVYIWQRRGRPGAAWLFVVVCGIVIWCAGYTLQIAFVSPLLKTLTGYGKYAGIVMIPTGLLAFSLAYTGRSDWFSHRAGWFAIVPVLTLLALWTDPLHHQFWSGSRILTIDEVDILYLEANYGFWLHAFYSYVLLLVGNVVLLQALLRSPYTYRLPFVVVIVGSLAPWAANALSIFELSPFGYLDLTPIAFCFTGAALAWGLYRLRLLDLRPMAMDLAVERMRDCLLVLDSEHHLIDLNPAARVLLQTGQARDAIGRPIDESLPALASLARHSSQGDAAAPVTIEINGESRSYEAQRISMRTQRTGCLILLHDITARQQTEDRLRALKEEADAASQAKSRFLAHMNHELRNPLMGILGHAEMMEMQMNGELNQDQQRSMRSIIDNGENLLAMINVSLDMSRIEAGRVTFYPEEFAVSDLVTELAEHVRPLVERERNHLYVTGLTMAGTIVADRVKVRQCLLNLLT
ncbi:MAG: histidine kinase N-terminal 7TM domain-containing protein, partial [Candidatus Latescibacteria bacterium]|nr:histidine kinase N-terminal 7TM domain-containing protein [Candidatus Latescibacterota bacterium]